MQFAIRRFASLFLILTGMSVKADVTVQSGPVRVHLLELFTSEGCSSCPPAERWFSTLRENPRLWIDFVPVAFHVDYWDGLGWKDRFASAAHNARQRNYAALWGSSTVYTPGFVLDGREWRARDLKDLSAPNGNGGMLTATLRESGEVVVTFQPSAKEDRRWQANVALLGLGLTSDVKTGENSGRKLQHDFVVLAHQSATMSAAGALVRASLKLPVVKSARGQAAFAAWITETGKTEPVQAAGGAL